MDICFLSIFYLSLQSVDCTVSLAEAQAALPGRRQTLRLGSDQMQRAPSTRTLKTMLTHHLGPRPLQVDLAQEMLGRLPPAAAQMLEFEDWHGGRLVRVESETVRPSVADLTWNACWLYAVCAHPHLKVWLRVIRGGHKCAGRVAGFLMLRGLALGPKMCSSTPHAISISIFRPEYNDVV